MLSCSAPVAYSFFPDFSISTGYFTLPCLSKEDFMDNSLDCCPAVSDFGRDFSSAKPQLVNSFSYLINDLNSGSLHCFGIIPNFVPCLSVLFPSVSSYLLHFLCPVVLRGMCLAAGAAGGLPDASLCRIGPRGLLLKRSSVLHLQIDLHNHFLLPTNSSQGILCAKAEKSSNRGVQSTQGLSTGPYSSSPQDSSPLSPTNLRIALF